MPKPHRMNTIASALCTLPLLALCVPSIPAPVPARADAPDQQTLQQRIDATAPGGRLELPAGTFPVPRTLTITEPITIVGQGADETILRSTADQPGEMIRIHDVAGVHLADFTLDGANNPNTTQGIVLTDGKNHQLTNLRIGNLISEETFGPHAIYAPRNLTDSRITHNEIHDIGLESKWGAGIRLADGCENIRVAHNQIRRVGRGGILTAHCTGLTIVYNEIRHYGVSGPGLGIELWGSGGNAIIEHNRVDHWISVDSQTDVAVRRNTIVPEEDRMGSYGLELVNSQRVIMTENVIDHAAQIGLSVSNDSRKDLAFWARNTVRGCGSWGAQIQGDEGGAHRMYFHDNTLTETQKTDRSLYPGDAGHGFRINDNAHRLVLDDNLITGNAGAGIQILGNNVDRLTFIDNTITNNAGPAVSAGGDQPGEFQGEHVLWVDNHVTENDGGNRGLHSEGFGQRAPLPNAKITLSGAPAAGQPLTLTVTGIDPDRVDEILWDMDQGLPQTGRSVQHTYPSPGSYTISAIIWLTSGRATLVQTQLTIHP